MTARWGQGDIPAARLLWNQIRLACGGTRANRFQTCRAYYLGLCEGAELPGSPKMACACRHWLNLAPRQRYLLIASRAGLPIGLIAHFLNDGNPKYVAAQIAALQGMAEIEPLKSHVERITERVPMWRERPAGQRVIHAAGM